MRNLTKELKNPVLRLASEPSRFTCVLRQAKNCCQGRGFYIDTSGQYTSAVLCECVKKCPKCFGKARYISGDISKPCKPVSPQKYVNLINNACIPSRYGDANLNNFANLTGNGREVVRFVREWCANYVPRKSKGIIFGGTVGVGKTYIITALAKTMAAKGFSVKFVDFFQLLIELRAGYSNDQPDASILQPLIDVDILIIDEMGKGRSSDWEISILDQLVMGRYNQKKIIIASTNYGLHTHRRSSAHSNHLDTGEGRKGFSLDELESLEYRVESRIYSRLLEVSHIFEMTGENYRQRLSQAVRDLSRVPTVSPERI